jgi:L-fucose isomerase-like protein
MIYEGKGRATLDPVAVMNPTPATRRKLGIIFIGRRRAGFDMDWGRAMEERVRGWLRLQTQFACFEPTEKAIDDTSIRRAMSECITQDVDAIAVLQTTMGDGRLAPTMAQLWPDPLILWATPENPEGDMISSCSLVGLHAWASTLQQMGRSFEIVYGDPNRTETRQRLTETVQIVTTGRKLRTVRLGMVGGQAPGYFAMSADPFAAHRVLGAQVQTYSLVEFTDVANAISTSDITADIARVKSLGIPHKDTTDDDLPMASRLYLAMRAYFENERLDALTVRCWPEMPNIFGQWPYIGIARLADEGRAIACEGDADGALTAWICESMGFGRCYLTDWLEHDRETITLWHGGAAPMSLSPAPGQPGGPRFARHFNIKKPAVVEATLRAGMPITVLRLWHVEGKYLLTAREGETITPRRHLMGTNGLVRMSGIDPAEWFEALCHAGMPHHVVAVPGHHAAVLKRFCRGMNIRFI